MDDLTPLEQKWAASMQSCAPGECLEADAILELANQGRRARNYAGRMQHVAICPSCRETLKLLAAAQDAKPHTPWLVLPVGRYLVAAGAAAAAIFAIWLGTRSGAPAAVDHKPLIAQDKPIERPDAPSPKLIVPTPPKKDTVAKSTPVHRPKRRSVVVKRDRPGPIHRKDVREAPESIVRFTPEETSGTVEGVVVLTQYIEGEVVSGGVVEGEVKPPPPPPRVDFN